MKVIIVHKGILVDFPPIINDIILLKELNHDVVLITEEINGKWRISFEELGVKIVEIPAKSIKPAVLGKILTYIEFGKKAKKIISQEFEEDSILWIEGAPTIMSLGKAVKQYHPVLQLSELHDKYKYQLKAIKRVIHNASAVVLPEYNRAVFYKIWFSLETVPFVLPNKPYFLPEKTILDSLENQYAELLDVFKSKKVILYQGHISEDRDLTPFVLAIKEMGEPYQCVLMGPSYSDRANDYKKLDPNLIHIDFIPAPGYLVFTSYAHIGVVMYDLCGLNNAYCAPNKIYEYGAYGKPMVGNRIPGLKVLEEFHAGVLADENVDSIVEAIKKIENDYSAYSKGALEFFSKTDNRKTIKKIISTASR